MGAARLPQPPRHLDVEQFEVRAALHLDAGAAAIDVRDAPGEQDYRPGAGVAITISAATHKGALQLQQRAVELSLPRRLEKWRRADEVGRLRIDLDVELVDLGADHNLCLRAFEFRPGREQIPIG